MTEASRAPINLMRGWPNASLLPVKLVKEAANRALSDASVAHVGLVYGPEPGYEPARIAIAAWLTAFYQPRSPISSNRICITGGASQSLGCLLNVYTDPEYTRKIWIVAPAYMLAFGIFEDAGFADKMRAVPEDESGLDIAYLRREMRKSDDEARKNGVEKSRFKPLRARAKLYKHVVYCVPTFANPSSRTMSLDRRRELVQAAREFDALVVADDVYDFLQWPVSSSRGHSTKTTDLVDASVGHSSTAHLPRLVDIDGELDGGAERHGADGFGNAISNGSFSKIAGPGIRVGWVDGTEKFAYGASQAGTTRSGGAPSQLTSTYVTNLLTSGNLQNHIETVLQPAYASRYSTIMRAISTHLQPLGFTLPQPAREIVGGYFIWLALPRGLAADMLAVHCLDEAQVVVAPGTIFEVPGDTDSVGFEGHVRLCFAYEEEWNLKEGVERIAKVAKKLLAESEGLEGVGRDGYVVVDKRGLGEFK